MGASLALQTAHVLVPDHPAGLPAALERLEGRGATAG
jgi:hypothetical protein